MNEKATIFEMLKKIAMIFNQDIPIERFKLYTEELTEYKIPDIQNALKKCSRECQWFPSLKEIVDRINPLIEKKDEGNEIAGAIIECIRNLGRYEPEKVFNYVGAIGTLVIQRFGGWELICNTLETDLNVTRAQLRDLAISALFSNERSIDKYLLPYQQKGKIKTLGESLNQLQLSQEVSNV